VSLLDALQHLPAVHLGHHHVEEDQVGRLLLERGQAFLRVRRLTHLVALHLEVDAHELAQARVVVDDQDRPRSAHLRIVLCATPKCFAACPRVSQSGSFAGMGILPLLSSPVVMGSRTLLKVPFPQLDNAKPFTGS
jgi:hypothetical protein